MVRKKKKNRERSATPRRETESRRREKREVKAQGEQPFYNSSFSDERGGRAARGFDT